MLTVSRPATAPAVLAGVVALGAALALATAVPWLGVVVIAGPAGVIAWGGGRLERTAVAALCVSCAVALGTGAAGPLPVIVPVCALAYRGNGRALYEALGLGRRHSRDVGMGLAVGLAASVVLFGWLFLYARATPFNPGAYVVTPLGGIGPPPLRLEALLAFAALSAFAEETVWRVALPKALARLGWTGVPALASCSLSFGAIHLYGVPWGWSGVALAAAFGAVMAVMLRQGLGLRSVLLAHFLVDVVVGAIYL